MEYKTQYTNRPQTIPHPKTSKYKDIYTEDIDNSGHKKLIKSKEKNNIYAKIQSYKAETEIYGILDRALKGDTEALNKHKGFYEDITEQPTNLIDAHNKLIDAKEYFNTLPLEIRKEFDHSVDKYIAAAINGTALDIINKKLKIDKYNNTEIKQQEKQEKQEKKEEGIKYE